MNDIRICLFARLREELGEEQVTLAAPAATCTVNEVIGMLGAERGARWAEVLRGDNLVIAVNHTVCSRETTLNPGDELAIFPPVTGG